MSKQFLNSQDVIGLLSKLKDSTPDYPTDLMAARKAAFLQQAFTITMGGSGLGGKGGGDGGLGGSAGSGGSGGTGILGGMSAAQTVLLQAVIGVWVIAAMLTAAYVFRDQIVDLLQDNGIVEEMTQSPFNEPAVPTDVSPATEAPTAESTPSPGSMPTVDADPDGSNVIESSPDDSKQNPGLHLGQTPGAPDTPNEENPDKPDKPDRPERPDNSNGR